MKTLYFVQTKANINKNIYWSQHWQCFNNGKIYCMNQWKWFDFAQKKEENIVEKVVSEKYNKFNFNQHCLLFPQYFLFHQNKKLLAKFILSSAEVWDMAMSKVLLFGNALTHYQTTKFKTGPNWNKLQTF